MERHLHFHVESFNKNMKALGVLESKWNPIRQKLVRRLLEEQDKVLRSYFAQKGGTRGQRRQGPHDQGREHVKCFVAELQHQGNRFKSITLRLNEKTKPSSK